MEIMVEHLEPVFACWEQRGAECRKNELAHFYDRGEQADAEAVGVSVSKASVANLLEKPNEIFSLGFFILANHHLNLDRNRIQALDN